MKKMDFIYDYPAFKKEMNRIVTKHYLFNRLQEKIEEEGRNPFFMGMLIGFFNCPETLKVANWRKLKNRFFEVYRKDIFDLTGYDMYCEEMKSEVSFPELFLETIGLFFKMGIISLKKMHTRAKVAARLSYYCNFPYTKETIRKKLENADTGSMLGKVFDEGKRLEKMKRKHHHK